MTNHQVQTPRAHEAEGVGDVAVVARDTPELRLLWQEKEQTAVTRKLMWLLGTLSQLHT